MVGIVPPIGTKGIFSLIEPFVASPSLSYEVHAIRTFKDLIARGVDPMKVVYEPVGLTAQDYANDLGDQALIITLFNPTVDPIYVPSTWIGSYPDMGVVPHQWVVASVSCGMLPESYDTQRIREAISQAVSDYTGVETTVHMTLAPVDGAITEAQYAQNLAARQAAIRNRSTAYADKLALQQQVEVMSQTISDLIQIIETLQNPAP